MEGMCSVGQLTLTECHKYSYVSKKGIENVSDLSEADREILNFRTGSTIDLKTICLHHKSVYLKKFEFLQKVCCDPLGKHKKSVKKSLRVITVQNYKYLLMRNIKVVPGQKLCPNCRTVLFNSDSYSVDENIENSAEPKDTDLSPEVKMTEKEKFNTSLTEVDCTPLKLHALPQHSRTTYGKQKFKKLQKNVKRKFEEILEVEIPANKSEIEKNVEEKAADMDKLVEIIRHELKSAPRKRQIQLLTIPASLTWTRKKIHETFSVSEYAVREAQKLVKEKGFVREPDPRCGKKIDPFEAHLLAW